MQGNQIQYLLFLQRNHTFVYWFPDFSVKTLKQSFIFKGLFPKIILPFFKQDKNAFTDCRLDIIQLIGMLINSVFCFKIYAHVCLIHNYPLGLNDLVICISNFFKQYTYITFNVTGTKFAHMLGKITTLLFPFNMKRCTISTYS